ncbi:MULTISPECIES: hypothetical protein [unclassified Bacillus (in: firmicutes)]|uniref:IS66 family insertion sequence element accessory protein TnpA n=1 Tax=unclassified Bacillus (in: firmicutes) TaxID=185979 RepID=UPI0027DFCE11|nr:MULTISPECIES: hypothetical protein [unclassified Bacillus (in: firmicutes)]
MPKTDLRKEWERRIAVFRASEQTQANWCAANDLKIHQFKYWLKRIEIPSQLRHPMPNGHPLLLKKQLQRYMNHYMSRLAKHPLKSNPVLIQLFLQM